MLCLRGVVRTFRLSRTIFAKVVVDLGELDFGEDGDPATAAEDGPEGENTSPAAREGEVESFASPFRAAGEAGFCGEELWHGESGQESPGGSGRSTTQQEGSRIASSDTVNLARVWSTVAASVTFFLLDRSSRENSPLKIGLGAAFIRS